ncbi:MAG: hypothetical protein NTZ94_16355 [Verrucomicrobia bacterium]|nr:hypothetical protein [Verrucomicrobiota bacterium]
MIETTDATDIRAQAERGAAPFVLRMTPVLPSNILQSVPIRD